MQFRWKVQPIAETHHLSNSYLAVGRMSENHPASKHADFHAHNNGAQSQSTDIWTLGRLTDIEFNKFIGNTQPPLHEAVVRIIALTFTQID
jgi:hypothetical protein